MAVEEVHVGLRQRLGALFVKYGATEENFETRHWEAFDRVLDATSVLEAELLAKRAEDKIFMTLLHLTASGKIFAKTPEAFRKKADRAEGLAHSLYKQYADLQPINDKEVKKRAGLLLRNGSLLARAHNLREYADRLEQDPNLPSFEELYSAKEAEDDAKYEAIAAAAKANPVGGGPDKPKRPRGRRGVQQAGNPVRVQPAPPRLPSEAKALVRRVRGAVAAKKLRRNTKDARGARPRRPRSPGR